MRRIKPEAALSVFFAATALCAVFVARDWPLSARLFPWLAGIPLIVLSLIPLWSDLMGSTGKTAKIMDFEFSEGVDPAMAHRRTVGIFAWIFGFALAIWLAGFGIAIPLTVFCYLKFQGREGWPVSLTLTAVLYLFFWAVFDRLLHLPMPEAKLWVWFGGA